MSDFGRLAWGPARDGVSGLGLIYGGYALDDSDDAVGATMHARKTGSITHVGMNVKSVTGSPPGYEAGVCTVDASTGAPSSTPLAGSAFGSVSTAGAGWQWVELATPAAVSVGDLIGIYVGPTGVPGAPDGSNKIDVYYTHAAEDNALRLPASWSFVFSWASKNTAPALAVKYSDGVVQGQPLLDLRKAKYDVADTPDEVGAKFTLPYGMRVYGVRMGLYDVDNNASYQVVVYDSANNVLGTITIADEDIHAGRGVIAEFVFPTPMDLAASPTEYRAILKATHASAMVGLYNFLWPDSDTKGAFHEGANWILTSRADGGAWTDEDGSAMLALLVDDITLPSGSSGPRWV